MRGKLVEEFWDNGILYQVYRQPDGSNVADEIPMSEYEYLYGEPDPNDTGEYYTEFMPRLDSGD